MKKFLIASVVLYIVVVMLGFGIHEGILGNDYRQLMHLFRPQPGSEAYMGYMFLSYLPYVLGVVWIYSMGVQRKPWLGQGVRFGIALWAVTWFHTYLVYFSLQPWPGELVVKQIGLSLVSAVIQGVVVAAIYKSEATDARHTEGAAA
jgi:hypothetical protein